MNVTYKRDLGHNFMVIQEEKEHSEDFRMKMLLYNDMDSMLKCNIQTLNTSLQYYYDITSKQTMQRMFERRSIQYKDLQLILTGFLSMIQSVKEYMLNMNHFILEESFIYMNVENESIYFCYYPGYQQSIKESFHKLTEYFLNRVDHTDKKAVVAVYELFRQTMEDNYNLEDMIRSMFDKNKQENYQANSENETFDMEIENGNKYSMQEEMRYSSLNQSKERSEIHSLKMGKQNDILNFSNRAEGIIREEQHALDNKEGGLDRKCYKTNKKEHAPNNKEAYEKVSLHKKATSNKENTIQSKWNHAGACDKDGKNDQKAVNKTNPIYLVVAGILTFAEIGNILFLVSLFWASPFGNKIGSDFMMKLIVATLIVNAIVVYLIFVFYKKGISKITIEEAGLILEKEESDRPKEVRGVEKKELRIKDVSIEDDFLQNKINPPYFEEKQEQDTLFFKENENEVNYGDTVILSYASQNSMKKLVCKSGLVKDFLLDKPNFLIGKMAHSVDGLIPKESISRIHAEIKNENESFYLTDLNSTNGTFLNGKRLETNEQVLLNEKDEITFAEVEFVFQTLTFSG